MKQAMLMVLGFFIVIQLIQIDRTNPSNNSSLEMQMPEKISNIFKKACNDCHSNHTTWPWYSYIAPMSWTIKDHVEDGRASVNYSNWNNYSKEKQESILKETFRVVYAAMPLPSYIALHKEADLSLEERKAVREWILSLGVAVH